MRIIIIGGNHAGIAAARTIREFFPEDEVVIFERKDEVAFISQTIPLFLMGHQDIYSQANYTNPSGLKSQGIDLRIETEVSKIDPDAHTVAYVDLKTEARGKMTYDKLIMATGSYSKLPPTGGVLNKTLYMVKTREDALAIDRFIEHASKTIIIGGGLVGVEMARILAKRQLAVTLIQSKSYILDRYLDERVAREVEAQLREEGIEILLDTRALDYHTIDKKIIGRPKIDVITNKGETLRADSVIVSVGFSPSTQLLQDRLETGGNGAFLVDAYMRTSNPDIYAVGDCGTTYMDLTGEHVYSPHASDAFRQGIVAGRNIHGNQQAIGMTLGTYKFNMDGFTIAVTGMTQAQATAHGYSAVLVSYKNKKLASDKYVSVHMTYDESNHRILGLQVIGTEDVAMYVNIIALAIQESMTVEALELVDFYFEQGYENPLGFTKILAERARAQGYK